MVETNIYTLDDNLYLTKSETTSSRDKYKNNWIEEYTYADGYWTKSLCKKYEDSFSSFTWANGNMVEIESNNGNMDYEDHTFTYTDKLNKMNINPFWSPNFSLMKFKGTFSQHLPSSYTESSNSIATFEYTFDSDGYPTKIVETSQRGTIMIYITYY